jgi:Family of unknown function (DUF6272)
MIAGDLYRLRNMLRQRRIMFCYSGYVNERVLGGVGEALKQKMVIEEADTKTLRSVFAVFVEQMQNIIRYSAEKEPELATANQGDPPLEIRYGVIAIGQSDEGFCVEAGNLVMKEDVGRLRSRLEEIRRADRAGLKALYKEKLKAPPDETSKGAGVGFIEIARRASKPIDFDFMDVDDDYAFFMLRAQI